MGEERFRQIKSLIEIGPGRFGNGISIAEQNSKYMVSSLFARVDQIFQGASPQALHLERLFPISAAQSRAPLLRDKVKTLKDKKTLACV